MKRLHGLKFIIFLLFVNLLLNGCVRWEKVSIKPEELRNNPTVLISPFKSAPITIKSWGGIGSFMLLGPLGIHMIDAVTKEGKDQVAEALNKIYGGWDPSMELANVCKKLLKENKKTKIKEINIIESRELPNITDLRSEEPNLFSSKPMMGAVTVSVAGRWMNKGKEWYDNNNITIQHNKNSTQMNADWVLEVFSSFSLITEGEEMGLNVLIKLYDNNTGKLLAKGVLGDFAVEIPNSDEKFDFKEHYRLIGRRLCSTILTEMGLLQGQ